MVTYFNFTGIVLIFIFPTVSWYLFEKDIKFTLKPPRPSNHPFNQIPFLEDGDVEVFESGAILLYLADAYGGNDTPSKRASYTKWVVWANSELDNICFGRGMSGTQLDKPNKVLDKFDLLLRQSDWLVDNTFGVADVAVGSYLNYVPVFFGSINMAQRPGIAKYMLRCAKRPNFEKAFGSDHTSAVLSQESRWLGEVDTKKSPKNFGLW